MNNANPLPCRRALDAECFKQHPQWARRAFAYRLLHVFFPPWLSRRLPKFLRLPLVAPGVDIPTEAYFPPGSYFPPGTVFPPGWQPGDPPPPGVYIPPWMQLPPGWTPGDPLPPGVTVDPTIVFPPGWTPDDPLPPGVEIDPAIVFPPDWTTADPLPTGLTIKPGTFFAPGWTPDDPLPDGATIDPGAVFPLFWDKDDPLPPGVVVLPQAPFPPDWEAGDLLPESAILPTELPPSIQETGVLPPAYIQPWEPGPVYWPKAQAVEPVNITMPGSTADGGVANSKAAWGDFRNGPTGTNVADTQTATNSGISVQKTAVKSLGARSFLYFDLSALPPDREVLLAILSVYGYNYHDSTVCVQEGTQGEPLHVDDWDAFFGDPFATLTWSTTWNEFEFNLWGRLYVRSKMGHTALFCLREHAHDYSNIPPAVNDSFTNGLRYAEYTNWGPKLEITYK